MNFDEALNKIEMALESKPRKNSGIYVNAEAVRVVLAELADSLEGVDRWQIHYRKTAQVKQTCNKIRK